MSAIKSATFSSSANVCGVQWVEEYSLSALFSAGDWGGGGRIFFLGPLST